jgi:hypothetical protein
MLTEGKVKIKPTHSDMYLELFSVPKPSKLVYGDVMHNKIWQPIMGLIKIPHPSLRMREINWTINTGDRESRPQMAKILPPAKTYAQVGSQG